MLNLKDTFSVLMRTVLNFDDTIPFDN